MEAANMHNKLILAVVQEDDYDATVSELNQNGFFVWAWRSPAFPRPWTF